MVSRDVPWCRRLLVVVLGLGAPNRPRWASVSVLLAGERLLLSAGIAGVGTDAAFVRRVETSFLCFPRLAESAETDVR
jgi:hypothetical protein